MKRWLWVLVVVFAAGQQAIACDVLLAPSAVVLRHDDVAVLAVPLAVETPVLIEAAPVIVHRRVIVERRARPVVRFFGRLFRRR